MPIEKPLPLMVGNKAYYSLTSYDPVEIEVDVPYTSEEDIQIGIEMTVADLGGTMADLDNPDWVAEHFDGLTTRQQVVSAMRQQVDGMNAQMAEEQKVGKCVEALSARLGQSIPPQHLEQARQAVQMRFTQQLQAEGITPDQFLARSGATMAQLDAMFDQQARQMCEGDAALSAYAHEKKLKVDEHEYGRLLGLSPDDLKTVMDQARAAGQLDELREAALRSKAAQIVVAECSCTYNHETPEQARRRIAQFRQMQQMYDARFGGDEPKDDAPEQGKTGFKLV
jgi:hypothetical protein